MRLAIIRERALKFLKAIGYKTATNWSNTEISKKLLNISDMIEGVDLEKFPMKKLLSKIIAADSIRIKSDNDNSEPKPEISKMAKKKKDKKKKKENEVVEEQIEEQVEETGKKKKDKSSKKDGKKKKDKSSKKDGKKKKDKSSKKDKKEDGDSSKKLDKFGCRKGTIKAKVNAALGKKSKTMAEIQEETGIENSQTGHLRDMIEAGYVVKTSKGYKLA